MAALTPAFADVLAAYESMTKQKAPKAQADALLWIKQQLTDFGIAGIPLRDLISFVKCGLQSPNALVRSSATQVLVTVRIFVGAGSFSPCLRSVAILMSADISGFLEDLNPQLLMTINSEFDKVAGQTPPEPTRTSKDLQNAVAGPGKAAGKAGGADLLDDLIPRLDLDKLVAQTSVVADSKSDAWKARKEAFESLNSLLEVKSNSRLKANMGKSLAECREESADDEEFRRDRRCLEKGNGRYQPVCEDAGSRDHFENCSWHGPALR
jgi:cytoskeleton-associated protein 5